MKLEKCLCSMFLLRSFFGLDHAQPQSRYGTFVRATPKENVAIQSSRVIKKQKMCTCKNSSKLIVAPRYRH